MSCFHSLKLSLVSACCVLPVLTGLLPAVPSSVTHPRRGNLFSGTHLTATVTMASAASMGASNVTVTGGERASASDIRGPDTLIQKPLVRIASVTRRLSFIRIVGVYDINNRTSPKNRFASSI